MVAGFDEPVPRASSHRVAEELPPVRVRVGGMPVPVIVPGLAAVGVRILDAQVEAGDAKDSREIEAEDIPPRAGPGEEHPSEAAVVLDGAPPVNLPGLESGGKS